MLDTSWAERDGKIYVRGTIINISEFGWSDVWVSIRGYDQTGRWVVNGQYKISIVPGHAACDFNFQTPTNVKPTRCEIGLISGKR